MSGSDLQEYIKKNLDADRLKPVGITPIAFIPRLHPSQLSDVAEGLRYLHSCNVVHGDLKGVRDYLKSHFTIPHTGQPNILVDESGNAHIADFGLTTVTQNPDTMQDLSCQHGHTPGWTAPEILNNQGIYSKEADIFSFVMVMIEVRHR